MPKLRLRETSCNLCHTGESEHLFSVRSFHVVRCPGCGLVYLNPMPDPEDIAGVYSAEYYRNENATEDTSLGYRDYLKLRDHHEFVADELLRPLKDARPGTVLDVGCGMGTMLGRFRELGWDAYGVDVSPYATSYARDELGLRVVTGSVEEAGLPEGFFDLVTVVHVIEHLPDPRGTLEALHRLVKPGGIAVIATHDIRGLWPRIVRGRWRHLNIPEHLYFFSRSSLNRMLEEAGFRTFRITETATLAAVTSDTGLYAPVRLLHRYGLINQAAPLLRGWHTVARKLNLSDGVTAYARRV